MQGDFAHSFDLGETIRYPYTLPSRGQSSRFLLRGGRSSAELQTPTKMEHGQELEKQHAQIYKMQQDLIKQKWMLNKVKKYQKQLDAKIRADKGFLVHNKNIYRHFKANVMDNVRNLGIAIDATSPIAQSFQKGGGFLAQYDRFQRVQEEERKDHVSHGVVEGEQAAEA